MQAPKMSPNMAPTDRIIAIALSGRDGLELLIESRATRNSDADWNLFSCFFSVAHFIISRNAGFEMLFKGTSLVNCICMTSSIFPSNGKNPHVSWYSNIPIA